MARLGLSLVLFLVVYLAFIRPSQNSANNAVKSLTQQVQQTPSQSSVARERQITGAEAARFNACETAAGTNLVKLHACERQYRREGAP